MKLLVFFFFCFFGLGRPGEWLVNLKGHKRRVTYVEWHPTAENILLSAGSDHAIIVWNIGTGQPVGPAALSV